MRIPTEVGLGTTICIYLPQYHGDATPNADEGERQELTRGSVETVLVVDDEATIRHLIDEVLDEQGIRLSAPATEQLGSWSCNGMPNRPAHLRCRSPERHERSAVGGCSKIAETQPQSVVHTGYADNAAVGNGHLEPGMELLTEPFAIEALSLRMADIVRRANLAPLESSKSH